MSTTPSGVTVKKPTPLLYPSCSFDFLDVAFTPHLVGEDESLRLTRYVTTNLVLHRKVKQDL